MNILNDLMSAVGTALDGFVSLMTNAFNSVIELIYISSGENQGFTTIGYLFILGLGIGIFYFVFRFIRNLLRLRAR